MKDSKKLSHVSVVINKLDSKGSKLNKDEQDLLVKLINWLILTRVEHITLFDQSGHLQTQMKTISKSFAKIKV